MSCRIIKLNFFLDSKSILIYESYWKYDFAVDEGEDFFLNFTAKALSGKSISKSYAFKGHPFSKSGLSYIAIVATVFGVLSEFLIKIMCL